MIPQRWIMHHSGAESDANAHSVSVWTLAQRSRSALVGLGIVLLGALLTGIAAKDVFHGDRDARWLAGIGLFLSLTGGLLARAAAAGRRFADWKFGGAWVLSRSGNHSLRSLDARGWNPFTRGVAAIVWRKRGYPITPP